MTDPGSFTIPCKIGSNFQGNALCDLGASVNVMPWDVYKHMGLEEVKPTTVTLVLADRSTTQPKGVIENVLVKVGKFIFPTDFLIVDCEVDWSVTIIMGRPFLATARAIIDVGQGEVILRVNHEQLRIKMNQTSQVSSYSMEGEEKDVFMLEEQKTDQLERASGVEAVKHEEEPNVNGHKLRQYSGGHVKHQMVTNPVNR